MCGRVAAKVSHQLHSCLDDICHFSKFTGVYNAVVAFIRLCKVWEFAAGFPVKVAAVYNDAAALQCMAIHILGCRMYHNICTKLNGLTQTRCCKCIIHNQWNMVLMGNGSKFFNIKHSQCRIGNGFSKYRLGIGLKCLLDFFFRSICMHPNTLDA